MTRSSRGVYCLDNNIAAVTEPNPRTLDPLTHGRSEVPPPAGLSPHAADPEAAVRLWELSAEMTGARLP